MADVDRENLSVIGGDTLTLDLTLLDINQDPVTDLVGAVAVMEVRQNVLDTELAASGIAQIDTDLATVQFTLTDEVTDTLLAPTEIKKLFQYGCKLIYSDGSELTILTGNLAVIRGVVV